MAASYFDLAADLGSEEEDGDYDEETGEPSKERLPKQRTTDNADSSDEEEEDDDDEEEQRKVNICYYYNYNVFYHDIDKIK